jgi:hypothetical protein
MSTVLPCYLDDMYDEDGFILFIETSTLSNNDIITITATITADNIITYKTTKTITFSDSATALEFVDPANYLDLEIFVKVEDSKIYGRPWYSELKQKRISGVVQTVTSNEYWRFVYSEGPAYAYQRYVDGWQAETSPDIDVDYVPVTLGTSDYIEDKLLAKANGYALEAWM